MKRLRRMFQRATESTPNRLALAIIGSLTLMGTDLAAQRTVVVYEEPRHRVVVDKGDIKLMDIQIQPGDTTLSHTHDSPILYTFISNGDGPTGGNVSSNTRYLTEPVTHAVNNQGPHLFRIIAMSHYGPGEPGEVNSRPDGLAGEPELENAWFRSYRLELAPGEETPIHRHRHSSVVIQVSDGRTEVSKATGFGAELTRMGDWTWRDPESPYTIRNAGTTPVSVVVNEARQGR
jgi:quercetin dioxygenase-like cupin family protein